MVNFKAFVVNFEGKARENTLLAGALPDFGLDNLLNEGNSGSAWRIFAVS